MSGSPSENERNAATDISAHLESNTNDTLKLDKRESLATEQAVQDDKVDLSKTSTTRKILMLSMFTLAEFLDSFNNSALFPAIPVFSEQLSFDAY